MSPQSSSAKLSSTWGKFATEQAARTAEAKLKAADINPEKITLETEDFLEPISLEDTEAIANLKTGAIAGAVLGILVGLSLDLVLTDFANLGLAAFKNFQPIHYFAPIMGSIVGAAGISLISGISGGNVPHDSANRGLESKRYLVVVKGTTEEIALSKEIIVRQGGVVEEADRR